MKSLRPPDARRAPLRFGCGERSTPKWLLGIVFVAAFTAQCSPRSTPPVPLGDPPTTPPPPEVETADVTAAEPDSVVTEAEEGRDTTPVFESFLAVNSVGFHPQDRKTAVLVDSTERSRPSDLTVHVVDRVSDQRVGQARWIGTSVDPQAPGQLHRLDFTPVQTPGSYRLVAETSAGELVSASFEIGWKVHDAPLRLMTRSYYLQRCGVALEDPESGLRHEACHTGDGYLARANEIHDEGDHIPSAGGWHDAGDFGKYIAPAAIAVARLLRAYEERPDLFPDDHLGIPESGNGVPDLLDEIRFELDWMLTQQRPDGAVYRKLSGTAWPSLGPPNEDQQQRLIYGISTPETAKQSAVLAQASRVFEPWDAAYAARLLHEAESAWNYLLAHPSMIIDWQKSDDSGSGKYLRSDIDTEAALEHDQDDRLWAAAELWLTTDRQEYLDSFLELEQSRPYTLFEWKDASALAFSSALFSGRLPTDIADSIGNRLLARAEELLEVVESGGYRVANRRLVWGSNKMTAEEGVTLELAYRLTGRDEFHLAAADQLDFLFGRNPFAMSYVTSVGSLSASNPSHIFGRAVGITVPGLLVGGANEAAQANIAPKNRGLLSWIDDGRSYATNENAIDYNASAIGLLVALTPEARDSRIEESPTAEAETAGSGPLP